MQQLEKDQRDLDDEMAHQRDELNNVLNAPEVVKCDRNAKRIEELRELLSEMKQEENDLMDQQQFIDTFAPVKELNFLMDTGHMHIQNWDMDLCFQALGSRILGYHLNDNFTDADSHLMAFEGSFDWNRFFRYYRQYTPDATLVCEYMQGPVNRIVDSIAQIKKHLAE